jgi:hypothetical protein
MAVDKHPSRKPSPPRKPPATSTTDGQANTVGKTMTGDGMMEYGSRNGKDLRIASPHKSERAHDFKAYTSNEGKAPKAGKEEANEGGKATRAGRVGDEKGNDEPG